VAKHGRGEAQGLVDQHLVEGGLGLGLGWGERKGEDGEGRRGGAK